MNQTIKNFLERNGIDTGNMPKEMNVTLTNPKNFNRFLDYFPVQKDKVKKYVCITDIIGSDAFKSSGSIYDLLDNLFNERNNPLHRKNTDLLELNTADIMEGLQISFSDDPVILAEYEGKYFVRTNGNHRVFAMYLNYLIEKQKLHTTEEIEKLNKKYTFPTWVMQIDTNMSYANFILQSKQTGKYIDRAFDTKQMKVTSTFEIVNGKLEGTDDTRKIDADREIVQDEEEVNNFVKINFIELLRNGNTYIIKELLEATRNHESFRKCFSDIFTEIEESDVVITLDKMDKEIYLAQPNLKQIHDFEELLKIINYNEFAIKNIKEQFAKLKTIVNDTEPQIEKYYSIMQIPQYQNINIDLLATKMDSVTLWIEATLDEAYRTNNRELYEKAQKAIQILAKLNLSIYCRTYYNKEIGRLKEKISQMAVKLQLEAQVRDIEDKKHQETEKKFGLLDKLRGKQRLTDAIVRNLELQKQYIQKTVNEPKQMEEAVRALYNYMKVHGETNEEIEFMEKLKKLNEIAEFIQLNKICIESFLPVKRHEKRISARKQAIKIEVENKEIAEKIRTEENCNNTKEEGEININKKTGILKTISDTIQDAGKYIHKEIKWDNNMVQEPIFIKK